MDEMRKALELGGIVVHADLESAFRDSIAKGTGVLRVMDDGSVKHIPYEDIVKALPIEGGE